MRGVVPVMRGGANGFVVAGSSSRMTAVTTSAPSGSAAGSAGSTTVFTPSLMPIFTGTACSLFAGVSR